MPCAALAHIKQVAYGAVAHAIEKGYITGIELDTSSKPDGVVVGRGNLQLSHGR